MKSTLGKWISILSLVFASASFAEMDGSFEGNYQSSYGELITIDSNGSVKFYIPLGRIGADFRFIPKQIRSYPNKPNQFRAVGKVAGHFVGPVIGRKFCSYDATLDMRFNDQKTYISTYLQYPRGVKYLPGVGCFKRDANRQLPIVFNKVN